MARGKVKRSRASKVFKNSVKRTRAGNRLTSRGGICF